MLLPPQRRPFHSAGIEVEHCSDSPAMTMDVEFIPVLVSPLFLFWCRHSNPQQVWISGMDGVDDGLVVVLGENGLVGWGIGLDMDVRIFVRRLLRL